jgi:aminoglycoside phosphotransferase (APT) family kinase protein
VVTGSGSGGQIMQVHEIDLVMGFVQQHLQTLRAAAVGTTLRAGSIRLSKVERSRNHVFSVETKAGAEFFLKVFSGPKPGSVAREVAGWRAMAELKPTHAYLVAPEPVGVGPESDFVLMPRVNGRPLNRVFYRSWLSSFFHIPSAVRPAFENLGKVLGGLHATTRPGLLRSNRDTRLWAERRAKEVGDPEWLARVQSHIRNMGHDPSTSFCHGNLAWPNILTHNEAIALIDFENSGQGCPLDDLSRVIAHMLFMQLASSTFRNITATAGSAVLRGYSGTVTVDMRRLSEWLYLHLLQYYQTRCLLGEGGQRVARIFRVEKASMEDWVERGPPACDNWLSHL